MTSNFKLNSEEEKLKEELRGMAESVSSQAEFSKNKILQSVEESYDDTEKKSSFFGFVKFFKRPLFLVPAAGLAILILAFVTMVKLRIPTYYLAQKIQPDVTYDEVMRLTSGGGTAGLGPTSAGLQVEAVGEESFAPVYRKTQPTFRDRFLRDLGRHKADPYEIAQRPPALEKDFNAEIMTPKKDEALTFAQNTFTNLGGFIEKVDGQQVPRYNIIYRRPRYRETMTIYGKVPAQNLETLKIMLKDFAGNEKYYREVVRAISRNPDLIEIEKKIAEVENSIILLEEQIKNETNLAKRQKLEQKLKEHKAYLGEREGTKQDIQSRIDFVKVRLTLIFTPTFWKASKYRDFKSIILGFEQASLPQLFLVRAVWILVILLHILSYTFWLIPFIVWYFWRKKKAKRMWEELE